MVVTVATQGYVSARRVCAFHNACPLHRCKGPDALKLKIGQQLTTFPLASQIGPLHSTDFLALPCTSLPPSDGPWLCPRPRQQQACFQKGQSSTFVRHSSPRLSRGKQPSTATQCATHSLEMIRRAYSHTFLLAYVSSVHIRITATVHVCLGHRY